MRCRSRGRRRRQQTLLELLATAVRDVHVQQGVSQRLDPVTYRVGVQSPFVSPSKTWSSTVKPIDSATVSRPAYAPSGSSPVSRLQTSGSGSPSVCATSKTGTGRRVATMRVEASEVCESVSAATRRVMGARIQMACSPRRTMRPSCPRSGSRQRVSVSDAAQGSRGNY